jgi:DNA modification methylase
MEHLNTIVCENALPYLRSLPDGFVHTCVCSPPYYGLRDYGTEPIVWGGSLDCQHEWGTVKTRRPNQRGGASKKQESNKGSWVVKDEDPTTSSDFCIKCNGWRGQLGQEPTPELYVDHLVEIFAELHRVLHKTGTLWVNIGDSYNGSGGPGSQYDTKAASGYKGEFKKFRNPNKALEGRKAKDIIGIPWMLAFALRDWGWWLRSDIIWSKGNPMPESVRDRCTRAHEYIFMLAKSNRYFYDQLPTMEPAKFAGDDRGSRTDARRGTSMNSMSGVTPPLRNKRTVWEINTKPFKGAHFAVFPQELIEPMILAGSPSMCCPGCGTPWERIDISVWKGVRNTFLGDSGEQIHRMGVSHDLNRIPVISIGERPTCQCYGDLGPDKLEPPPKYRKRYQRLVSGDWVTRARKHLNKSEWSWVPGRVIDPFMGSGTTALVGLNYNRDVLGCDNNPKYVNLALGRLKKAGFDLTPKGVDSKEGETEMSQLGSGIPTQANKVVWNPGYCPPGTWIQTTTGAILFIIGYNQEPGTLGLRYTAKVRSYPKFPSSVTEVLGAGVESEVKVPDHDKGQPYLVEVLPKPEGSDRLEAGEGIVAEEPAAEPTGETVVSQTPPAKEVVPDKCKQHPKYKGVRAPRTGCPTCQAIFNMRHSIKDPAEELPRPEPMPVQPTEDTPPAEPTAPGFTVLVASVDGSAVEVDVVELIAGFGKLLEDLHNRVSALEEK